MKKEGIVEAVLFLSGKFMELSEISSLTGIETIELKEILTNLISSYDKKEGGIKIIERNGNYKMDIHEDFAFLVNRIVAGGSEFGKAEKETLAVIAYKQPIKQSMVIQIRGNKAYEHIKKFLDLNLINTKKAGHTYILSLSDNFYNYFSVTKDRLELLKFAAIKKEAQQKAQNQKGEV